MSYRYSDGDYGVIDNVSFLNGQVQVAGIIYNLRLKSISEVSESFYEIFLRTDTIDSRIVRICVSIDEYGEVYVYASGV